MFIKLTTSGAWYETKNIKFANNVAVFVDKEDIHIIPLDRIEKISDNKPE